jgi:transcriptional regulator with XRE-family HTH domain
VEFANVETKSAMTAEDRYRAAAGAVFRRLREGRGWSLRDFGEQAGAAHTSLYAVERGETTPGIDVLDRVAAAFDMDLAALLSLIIDQLDGQRASSGASLPELVVAFSRLDHQQRSEALIFIDYLRYRDREDRSI